MIVFDDMLMLTYSLCVALHCMLSYMCVIGSTSASATVTPAKVEGKKDEPKLGDKKDSAAPSSTPAAGAAAGASAGVAVSAKVEGKKDEPKLGDKKDSAAPSTATAATPAAAATPAKVEEKKKATPVAVGVSVRNVTKTDILSASDPVVRVAIDGQLVSQTEWVKDRADYDFKTPLVLPLIIGQSHEIRVFVYDIDKPDAQPSEKDLVGDATISSASLLSELSVSLQLTNKGKSRGTIILRAAEAAVIAEAQRTNKGELVKRNLLVAAR